MAVELVRDGPKCLVLKVNGRGIIYLNEHDDGTVHIYKDIIKGLGINILYHDGD